MDRGVVVGVTEDEELSSLREQTTNRANRCVETEIVMTFSKEQQEEEARVPGVGLNGHYPEAAVYGSLYEQRFLLHCVGRDGILWRAGKESMKTLDAGDLSNLAWAIARLANEKSTSAGFDSELYFALSCWICESILELADPNNKQQRRF